jgi:hypothetical protein
MCVLYVPVPGTRYCRPVSILLPNNDTLNLTPDSKPRTDKVIIIVRRYVPPSVFFAWAHAWCLWSFNKI